MSPRCGIVSSGSQTLFNLSPLSTLSLFLVVPSSLRYGLQSFTESVMLFAVRFCAGEYFSLSFGFSNRVWDAKSGCQLLVAVRPPPQ